MASADGALLADAFRAHQRYLWALVYRMTGSSADADDVVQDTFVRVSLHPPARMEDLRPWLVRVAMNAARDSLRARKARAYVGPWLPSPIEDTAAPTEDLPDARYERRESASYAFLIALEALTPAQRGVLLLTDVLDYSVRETAEALDMTEANVKVTHHRARKAMGAYDAKRAPAATLDALTGVALQRFLVAVMSEDGAGVEACLAEDARLLSDGGGQYRAALRPVLGPSRIQRFFLGLMKKLGSAGRFEVRAVNGLPAIVAEYDEAREGWGPRFVMRCDVDPLGVIREVHIVVASAKLEAIRPLG